MNGLMNTTMISWRFTWKKVQQLGHSLGIEHFQDTYAPKTCEICKTLKKS